MDFLLFFALYSEHVTVSVPNCSVKCEFIVIMAAAFIWRLLEHSGQLDLNTGTNICLEDVLISLEHWGFETEWILGPCLMKLNKPVWGQNTDKPYVWIIVRRAYIITTLPYVAPET